MNAKDKSELKEILHDYVGGIVAIQDAKYETIISAIKKQEETSNRIENQTIKTNGAVAAHAEKIHQLQLTNAGHIANCPQTDRIEKLDNKFMELIQKIDNLLLPVKFFIEYPWFISVGIGAVVIGIIVMIFEIFIKK
jgi:hypothetical protein